MKQKIILCKGLPASGKSTWSKLYCQSNLEFVRLSRDDIRIFLGDPEWTREFEDDVTSLQRVMAEIVIKNGKSLVIDDSNFAQKHQYFWKTFADKHDLELSEQFFDVPVNECIKRDLLRKKPVGIKAIMYMYETYLKP